MSDAINPDHYKLKGGIQVIQLTEQLDFLRGNVVKYVARAGKKGTDAELQDLKKAEWYLARAIANLENDTAQKAE